MNKYVLTTDSTVDMTEQMIKDADIYEVFPLTFRIEDKDYEDGALPAHEFYDMLRNGSMATTSQVNVDAFKTGFEKILNEGFDILHVGFSSGLSGSVNSAAVAAAELAEQYPDRTVAVVDTLAASLGEGLLVWHAGQRKKDGATLEEVREWLEQNKLHMCHWFTVDDLNFLKRGGRLSGAAAYFGTMLGIKPVMHMDDAGHLVPVAKVRGRKTSLDALVDNMERLAVSPGEQMVFISHGDCEDEAKYVADEVKKRFGTETVLYNNVGPVIGSHSGPGTMALFFLGTER